ncbi:hypothetical protein Tco_0722063 [Tanacetum coccineum]
MHLGENLLALGSSGISPNHNSSADSSTSVGTRSEPKDPLTVWDLTVSSSISLPDGFFFNLTVQHSTASTSSKTLALPQKRFHGSLLRAHGFSSFEGLTYSGISGSMFLFNNRCISSLTTSFLISGRIGRFAYINRPRDMSTHSPRSRRNLVRDVRIESFHLNQSYAGERYVERMKEMGIDLPSGISVEYFTYHVLLGEDEAGVLDLTFLTGVLADLQQPGHIVSWQFGVYPDATPSTPSMDKDKTASFTVSLEKPTQISY